MRAFQDMGRGNRGQSLPWNVTGGSAVEAVVRSLPIHSPERFALHLGTHIVSKYAHVHRTFVTLEKLRIPSLSTPTFVRSGWKL